MAEMWDLVGGLFGFLFGDRMRQFPAEGLDRQAREGHSVRLRAHMQVVCPHPTAWVESNPDLRPAGLARSPTSPEPVP